MQTLAGAHQPPRLLLIWLPVHASEQDGYLLAAVDCLFQRWTPSVDGLSFDVLVTLAARDGTADADGLHARLPALQSIIADGVAHLGPPPPHVTALPVLLTTDAYDVDEAPGRASSFAGPNELFYRAMGGLRAGGLADSGGDGGGGNVADPVAATIARYPFVQVIETDCCATGDGWMETLLQPMLTDPALLISGSRGRGACWTGAEYGGCRPTVDPATPHAHLRDHVNGNAMYRVGGELSQLIAAARAQYGATVPFDVAMHLVGGGKRTADNARAYSVMGLPVDGARFTVPAYYGTNIAFVHAPRRLRAHALQAVARRLEAGRPVTVVVVPADGVDEALLGHLYKGLIRARETRNALFLATDEAGYAAAVRVAPMRVVMAGEVAAVDGLDARPVPDSDAARILTSLAALARAGFATFTIGTDAAVLQPYTKHLAVLTSERADTTWALASPTAVAPLSMGREASTLNSSPSIQPGMLLLPAGEQAAAFAARWATAVQDGSGRLSVAALQSLANAAAMSVASLPADLFPPASSYTGPLWTDRARRLVAAVVGWDGEDAVATPAALSAAGLWNSATPFPHPGCTNYSVLAAHPLPLTSPASIHRSLAARAGFGRFVRRHAIACVVLPGFQLGTTGSAVPDGVVVRGEAVGPDGVIVRGEAIGPDGVIVRGEAAGSLAGAAVFASVADLVATCRGKRGSGQLVPFHAGREGDAVMRKPPPSPHWAFRWGGAARRPATSTACAAFNQPGTTCFSPLLAAPIDAAAAALSPLGGPYQCVLDTRRSHQEVGLLSMEGRLGEVAGLVNNKALRQPALLTGAWRHVRRGQWHGNGAPSHPPLVTTLADLATPPAAPVDPLSRLVWFGPAAASPGSLASSPWADVIEYALCQGAAGVVELAGKGEERAAMTEPLLFPSTPSSLLARLAAHIPPAVLDEDLTTFARWLARPDRPSLSAQRARLDLPGGTFVSANAFQNAVLAPSLGLAKAAGAKLVALPPQPVPWSVVVGEAALRQAYSDHAGLLPASVGVLLGDTSASVFVPATESTPGPLPHHYQASVDVLRSPGHRAAVQALDRVLEAVHNRKAHRWMPPRILAVAASATPAEHGRLRHFARGARSLVFTF